ncbi:MAG: hypothetical protein WB689_00055, partial [Xanthobacteraceae bacterium]
PSRTASASQRIHKEWAATRVWRYNFRHHVITIRDQYGFATSRIPWAQFCIGPALQRPGHRRPDSP